MDYNEGHNPMNNRENLIKGYRFSDKLPTLILSVDIALSTIFLQGVNELFKLNKIIQMIK